ncbi:DUF2790 domain-containing protein [Pseudomonas stutzeri]|nr:DUF2790 domain-containing protein [Stutzerimonas stutzeri]
MKPSNNRSILFSCCAAAMIAAASVVVAQTEAPPLMVMKGVKEVRTPEFKEYQYGMPLDISKVVKIEYFIPDQAKTFCGVIPAAMTYQDSQGQMQGLVYLYPETSGCTN